MNQFIVIIIGIIFVVGIFKSVRIGIKGRKKTVLLDIDKPKHLGITNEKFLPIIEKLEKSLASDYLSKLESRLLKENPKLSAIEFEWRLLELKRYFVLNSVLKSVPMFSEKVDDVWHEMLMFTKEYETFTSKFFGSFLHHSPNLEVVPIPGERAFFDWIYLQIFELTPNSRILWGDFLRNPIQKEIVEDFKNLSTAQLLQKYFHPADEWLDIKEYLILKLKTEIENAKFVKGNNLEKPFNRITTEGGYQTLLGAMVFYSIYETDNYDHNIHDLLPHKEGKHHDSNATACIGFGCSTSSYNSSSDGDSGGGSSCSSCGGGCSS